MAEPPIPTPSPGPDAPPEGLSPEALAMWEAYAQLYGQQQAEEAELTPAVLRGILGGLGLEVPYTMEEIEEAATNLARLELFERSARLFGVGPDQLDPLQEELELARSTLLERATDRFGPEGGGPVFQAISEYVTSTVDRQELASREEVLTRREYFDVPTPEYFLNEFDRALATHTQQLVETGELDRDTAQWIRDNPDILFDEYIAELGTRAAAGEEIFTVAGLEGEPELLGTRPGRQEARTVATERGALTETLTEAQQAAQATRAGVTTPTTTQRTTQEQQRLREKVGLGATFAETEEIYGRPRLDYVYALSPLDWLQERATGMEITYGAEREKGRRVEERRGAVAVTPRRVK